jgi:predicted phage terminase large subunit-like protein
MMSPWYQELWGDRFNFTGDQNAKQRYENDKGGYRIAAAVRGQLTGDGGSIVTVDDALNASDASSDIERQNMLEWWDETMSTRLNDPKTGAYVLVMQRLHEKDLIGHVMDRESGWVHVCLPARYEPDHPHVFAGDPRKIDGELLWPARVGEAELKELEGKLGPSGSSGQLQQRPTPRGGGMFKPEWLRYYDHQPPIRTMNLYILVDPANAKKKDSDWTAIFVIGAAQDGNFYVLDLIRDRLSLAERIRTLFKLHRTWRAKGGNIAGVGYERYGIQADIEAIQMQMNREGYSFNITELGGALSKTDRVARLEPLFYAGKIRLPYAIYYTQYDGIAVELINYLVEREYKNFPVSEYKDCLDALSRLCDDDLSVVWPDPLPEGYDRSYQDEAASGSWMV